MIESAIPTILAAQSTQSAIRLVAVDMDGTLLNEEAAVPPRTLAAIAAAEQAGIHFVIATGRRHSYAMRVLRSLALTPENILITSNGAVVRTVTSRPIETTHLSRATTLWLLQQLGDFRNALVLTFDHVGSNGDDTRGALVVEHLDDLHASIGKWMQANEPSISHISPIERALDPDINCNPPLQAMLCGTVARMRLAEALLLQDPRVAPVGRTSQSPEIEIQLARTEYPDRDLSILDILPAQCSKGAAILRFAGTHGIAPEDIMAIGDNWNDLSMLEAVGHPVLMQNAPEDLHDIAAARGWRIAPPNTEEGVAYILESILKHSR